MNQNDHAACCTSSGLTDTSSTGARRSSQSTSDVSKIIEAGSNAVSSDTFKSSTHVGENWKTGYPGLKSGVFRFLRDDNQRKAPLLKPHLITHNSKAPFTGPHSALPIIQGPDKGSYLHVTVRLTAADVASVADAISWVWTDFTYSDRRKPKLFGVFGSPSRATKPFLTIPKKEWKLLGPPGAEYPLTRSVEAPFAGPRTIIFNAGRYFTGWYLHVPRLLTVEEIRVAETNLRYKANRKWHWGKDNDARDTLVRPEHRKRRELAAKYFKDRDEFVEILENVVVLDFEAQDCHTRSQSLPPIWKKIPGVEYAHSISSDSSSHGGDDRECGEPVADDAVDRRADGQAVFKRQSEALGNIEYSSWDPVKGKFISRLNHGSQRSRSSGSTVSTDADEMVDDGTWPSPPPHYLGFGGPDKSNADEIFPMPDALGRFSRPPRSLRSLRIVDNEAEVAHNTADE